MRSLGIESHWRMIRFHRSLSWWLVREMWARDALYQFAVEMRIHDLNGHYWTRIKGEQDATEPS